MSLEAGSGGSVGSLLGLGVLMVKALLKAAPGGEEDGFGGSVLWCVAARDSMVCCVGGGAGAVNLKQDNRVEETPGWFEVSPLLEGYAAQARRLEAEAGDGKERSGEVKRVASGAAPRVGNWAPDVLKDGGAVVILVDCRLFRGVGACKAACAQGRVAVAFDGSLKVSVMNGDNQVMGFLRRDRWVCDAICDGSDASLSRRGREAGYEGSVACVRAVEHAGCGILLCGVRERD